MNVTTEFHCCSAVSRNYGGKTREIIIIMDLRILIRIAFCYTFIINYLDTFSRADEYKNSYFYVKVRFFVYAGKVRGDALLHTVLAAPHGQ